MSRRRNPFVPRGRAMQYIVGSSRGTVYKYRGLIIEVERVTQKLDGTWWWKWIVYDDNDKTGSGIFHSGGGAMDEHSAAVVARYAADLDLGMRELGTATDSGEGWNLGNAFQLLADDNHGVFAAAHEKMPDIQIPHPTAATGTVLRRKLPGRSEVARELRTMAGRGGANLPHEWQREGYEWFQKQPLAYRTKLIDRVIELKELKTYGIDRRPKQPSFPRTWPSPNPKRRKPRDVMVNPSRLKHRCLR